MIITFRSFTIYFGKYFCFHVVLILSTFTKIDKFDYFTSSTAERQQTKQPNRSNVFLRIRCRTIVWQDKIFFDSVFYYFLDTSSKKKFNLIEPKVYNLIRIFWQSPRWNFTFDFQTLLLKNGKSRFWKVVFPQELNFYYSKKVGMINKIIFKTFSPSVWSKYRIKRPFFLNGFGFIDQFRAKFKILSISWLKLGHVGYPLVVYHLSQGICILCQPHPTSHTPHPTCLKIDLCDGETRTTQLRKSKPKDSDKCFLRPNGNSSYFFQLTVWEKNSFWESREKSSHIAIWVERYLEKIWSKWMWLMDGGHDKID